MFQQMKKRIKNEKGLTLIELLAVIVILAIIAAIAIPAIGNIIDSSRVKAAKADAANVLSAANLYFTENPSAKEFKGAKAKAATKAVNGATENETKTEEWQSYVADLGTIETFTVMKVSTGNTITTTGESGGKAYKIESTTLAGLKVDSGKEEAPFSWGTNTNTDPTPDPE